MQIEMMPTERLVPYARNARTHSEAQVADLVSSRHDDVQLSIERLSDRGVSDVPPLREHQTESSREHTDPLCQRDDAFGDVVGSVRSAVPISAGRFESFPGLGR